MNSTDRVSPTTTTFEIEGMSCGHCVARVSTLLASVPGVHVNSVKIGSAQIATTDPAAETAAQASLAEAGFAARRRPSSGADKVSNASQSGGCCG